MAKLYKIEIQTNKEGTTSALPVSIIENEDNEIASRQAESAYHTAVASMLVSEQLSEFLCFVITETGYVDPKLSRFYKFPEDPGPEPNVIPEE